MPKFLGGRALWPWATLRDSLHPPERRSSLRDMAKYMVAYDLAGTDETSADYERLISQIQTCPWWGKIQKSAWIIKTPDSAAQLRSALTSSMDANDRLFVAALTGETAWTKVLCDEEKLRTALMTP